MNSPIVAVDASGKAAGVCVLAGGAVLFQETLPQGLTHSQTLLPLVQKALGAAGLAPQGVGLWAVTAGPGSFTGLRIGLALVKGLAFPFNKEVAPVSTLAAVAAASGLAGMVVAALDARRGEVYAAAFSCTGVPGGCTRLCPDAAQNPQMLAEIVRLSAAPVFFVGDGAEMCYTIYGSGQNVQRPSAGHSLCAAKGAAFLAGQMRENGEVLPAADVRPRYLRLSQAQRQRAARMQLESSGENI